jgi:hypothetical protein
MSERHSKNLFRDFQNYVGLPVVNRSGQRVKEIDSFL